MQEQFNILVNLNTSEWKECRKIIIHAILGTDMMHHFEQISKTQVYNILNIFVITFSSKFVSVFGDFFS